VPTGALVGQAAPSTDEGEHQWPSFCFVGCAVSILVAGRAQFRIMDLGHHSKTTEAGYSLVELMLVLTIIGKLGVLATPFFLTYYQASRLRVGAEEVAAFVNLGRQLAIRQNSTACVHIGSAAVQYYVGGAVAGGSCTCACSAWVGPGTDSTGKASVPQGIAMSPSTDFVF